MTGPEPANDLAVTATTASATVFIGSTVEATAVGSGGTPPYFFRWDQNAAPADVALEGETTATLSTAALTEPGRYVFRVVVTDGTGLHDSDYLAVSVGEPVEAEVPALAVVGQPVQLSADTGDAPAGTTVRWEVTAGAAELDDPTSETAQLTAAAAGTIGLTLAVTTATGSSDAFTTTKQYEIAAVPNLHPRVLIETSMGDFTIELDGELAPLHTANFLLYVDDGFYDGLLFHRVVCQTSTEGCEPFVAQGGGYHRENGELVQVEPTREPVPSEADNGLTNGLLYTVALALTVNEPDSGTTQFFVNLDEDNGSLDAQGFTVFAQVTSGTDIVDAIAAAPTVSNPVFPGEQSLPEVDIIIERTSRLAR